MYNVEINYFIGSNIDSISGAIIPFGVHITTGLRGLFIGLDTIEKINRSYQILNIELQRQRSGEDNFVTRIMPEEKTALNGRRKARIKWVIG